MRIGAPADWLSVTEDNELARVFGHLITPAVDLNEEPVHSGEALDVAGLAPDDTALLDGL